MSSNDTVSVDFGGKGEYSEPEFEWQDSVELTALKFFEGDTLGRNYQNGMFVRDISKGRVYHFDLDEDRTKLDLRGSLSDKIIEDREDDSRI